MAGKKPLLFGDLTFDAERLDAIDAAEDEWDWSYTPGYSEQRRANDLLVKDGKKAVPIDKLYWVRVGGVDGTGSIDYRQRVATQRLGYRACTVDDLKKNGWGMPPAAHISADGLIRRDDVALAIVDFERADKNRRRQEEKNAKFHGTPVTRSDAVESLAHSTGKVESLEDAEHAFSAADAKDNNRR